MAVPVTCKYDEDPIKNEVAVLRTILIKSGPGLKWVKSGPGLKMDRTGRRTK